MTADKATRRWTLEFDSNFDDHPPLVIDGPPVSGFEGEVEVIEARAYDALVADLEEMKFHWQQATRFVMPGEFDTSESIVKHLKEKDATIIRQVNVIQTLLDGLEQHFGKTFFWTSPLGNKLAAMMKDQIS